MCRHVTTTSPTYPMSTKRAGAGTRDADVSGCGLVFFLMFFLLMNEYLGIHYATNGDDTVMTGS
jgi:hypothetical protein